VQADLDHIEDVVDPGQPEFTPNQLLGRLRFESEGRAPPVGVQVEAPALDPIEERARGIGCDPTDEGPAVGAGPHAESELCQPADKHSESEESEQSQRNLP